MITNELIKGENDKIFFIVIKGNKHPGRTRIDSDNTNLIHGHLWSITKTKYVKCTKHGEYFHRIVMDASYGQIIDHKNNDTLDNRKTNLRVATHQENMRNRRAAAKSQTIIKGISIKSGKWHAEITVNGRSINLGYYSDPYDAAMVRIRKEYELFGEFSYNYKPILKTIPLYYKRYWIPEVYGKDNYKFIGSNFHRAFFKNDKENINGMIKKMKRYAKYGDAKTKKD